MDSQHAQGTARRQGTHVRDLAGGVLLIAVGLGFAAGSLQYGLGTSVRPGPGYFPLGLGVLLALVGAVLSVQAVRPDEIDAGDDGRIGPLAWRPLVCVLGAALLFAVLLPRLGLLVSLPVLVLVSALAVPQPNWKATGLLAALLTLGAWLLFSRALGLSLPILPSGMA